MNQDNKATVSFAAARCYWHAPSVYEKHHPGSSAKTMFINSPSLFSPVMSAMRPLMSQDTNEIMDNYGDENEWKPLLLDWVDPEQLPPSYGGTKGVKGGKGKILVGTFHGDANKPRSWSWPKAFGFRH
ncbi:SEC14-like protein 2 [Folsomia candida]|uniref:SEC14-like protein 2 n=1 Tax=Folsomia candida TaxID=158441 RepID=UPI001604AD27|nr:SEC14-like protein 2 [Folsomia candida]